VQPTLVAPRTIGSACSARRLRHSVCRCAFARSMRRSRSTTAYRRACPLRCSPTACSARSVLVGGRQRLRNR
jgi:hypothetical protein